MKKFRKIAAVLLCVVMIAVSLQCLAFAAPQDSGKLNFLVLGDSIAEGFGVENKEDAAYGKIVADTNGYNYRNLAQVANDTQDLIRKIKTVDEFRESIAWADVINICIGSNNYLASKDVVRCCRFRFVVVCLTLGIRGDGFCFCCFASFSYVLLRLKGHTNPGQAAPS